MSVEDPYVYECGLREGSIMRPTRSQDSGRDGGPPEDYWGVSYAVMDGHDLNHRQDVIRLIRLDVGTVHLHRRSQIERIFYHYRCGFAAGDRARWSHEANEFLTGAYTFVVDPPYNYRETNPPDDLELFVLASDGYTRLLVDCNLLRRVILPSDTPKRRQARSNPALRLPGQPPQEIVE